LFLRQKSLIPHVQGAWMNCTIFPRAKSRTIPYDRMALCCRGSYNRRCIMAIAVQQIYPMAHLPLGLGVVRRLAVATVIDRLLPPHPAHVLSTGRGVKALVLAILDGEHAL
jgi:hypothetical protein